MNKFFLSILLLGFTLGFFESRSQSTSITTLFHSNFRKAEIYYNKMAYLNAIELYERVLEKKPDDLEAKERIADSYRYLNNTKLAEEWYSKIVEEPGVDSINLYHYAQMLAANAKYDLALDWYKKYSEIAPGDSRPPNKIRFLNNIEEYLTDSSLYEIDLLRINSEHSDFGALYYKDGIVFLSTRNEDLFIKHQSSSSESEDEVLLDLYYSLLLSDDYYTEPEKFHKNLNSKLNEGPLTFYSTKDKMIFTRNSIEGNKTVKSFDDRVRLNLYTADLDEDNNWSKLNPFPYNNESYSVAHPSLSPDDQTLLFSSDMPGGFGGSDIYMSIWQGNKWGEPFNLGPEVNTEGDELYPYLADENTLYFVSDGLGGFGGMDIYQAKKHKAAFGSIINLMYPINTNYDDFSFTIDEKGREGFFSSNRPGGIGSDDIYHFDALILFVKGKVLRTEVDTPVPEAKVTVLDKLGEKIRELNTDSQGNFNLNLPFDQQYTITAEKDSFTLETPVLYKTSEKSLGNDSVTVYMWKHTLFAKGRIFSNETQQLIPGTEVVLDNLSDNTITKVTTKEDGTYSFVLEQDKLYLIQAEKEHYIPDGFRLNTEGLKEGILLNDIVLEEEYVNKSVIFFDFDKSYIRKDAEFELDRMVSILKKHRGTRIVISAHADAYGSKEYNQKLSDARADAAVRYLLSRGIDRSRITARGFGEQLLINRCSDGVECPEEEHSKNRRAELKIER